MKSKTSFFNKFLYLKNLTRFWPLWALPAFVMALFPIVSLLNYGRYNDIMVAGKWRMEKDLLEVINVAMPITQFIFAFLVAMAVWGYLFNNSSVNLFHAIPVSRTSLFVTNYLSGLTIMLIPFGTMGFFGLIKAIVLKSVSWRLVLEGIWYPLAITVIFFSIATLTAMLTGHMVVLPILYNLLSFLSLIIFSVIQTYARGFLWGIDRYFESELFTAFSPVVYLAGECRVISDEVEQYAYLKPTGIYVIYFFAGLAVTAFAFLIYRKRKSELAREVIAADSFKKVLFYLFAVVFSLTLGLGFYSIFDAIVSRNTSMFSLGAIIVCIFISAAIVYYGLTMIVNKSFKVFCKKNFFSYLILSGALVFLMILFKVDVLGIEKKIPESKDIDSVWLHCKYNYGIDASEIEAVNDVLDIHKMILENEDEIRATETGNIRPDFTGNILIEYTLKSGRTLTREYNIPVFLANIDEDSVVNKLNEVVNRKELMMILLDGEEGFYPESANVNVWSADYYYDGSYYDSTNRLNSSLEGNKVNQLLDVLRRDAVAGNFSTTFYYGDQEPIGQYFVSAYIEYAPKRQEGYWGYSNIQIDVTKKMTNTLRFLKEEGMLLPEMY